MFGRDCGCWESVTDYNHIEIEPQRFTLPSPIPHWPQGIFLMFLFGKKVFFFCC